MNKLLLSCLVAVGAISSVLADYVTLVTDDKPSGGVTASSLVSDTGHWSIPGTPDSSHDYYVGEGRLLCTPNINNDTATYTFQGRSLTLDGGSGFTCLAHCSKGSSTVNYGSGQVYLKSGVYSFNANGATTIMNATVEASADDPFVFLYNCDNDKATTVIRYLTLDLAGAAGTGLRFTRPDNATSPFIWKLSGSAVYFDGTLDVRRMTVVADAAYPFSGKLLLSDGATFKFGNKSGTNSIGELDLGEGGALTIDGGTSQEVGTLRLDGGTINFQHLRIGADKPSNYGFITVTTAVVADQPVTVNLDEPGDTVSPLGPCDRAECPLIRFPKGTTLSADHFRLVLCATFKERSGTTFPPLWSAVVKDDEDGYPTLYAIREEVVELKGVQNVKQYGLKDAATWTDGNLPHADVSYHAFGSYCQLAVDDEATEFKGDWLFSYYGQTWLYASEFTIPRWTVRGNHKVNVAAQDVTIKGGTWEVVCHSADVWTEVLGSDSSAHALTIASDLCGDGQLTFNVRNGSTEAGFNSLTLTGDNAAFAGKLAFNQKMTVAVSDAQAFGGAHPSVDYMAVSFLGGSKFRPTAPLVFDEPTCGFAFGASAFIYSTTENPLTIKSPVTLLGGQQKWGNGPLALGGPLKFGETSVDEQAEGNVTDCYLSVREGSVKPLTADAFNGYRFLFYNGTGIVIDWNATGDLRTYGLRATKRITAGQNHISGNNDYVIPITFDTGDVTELDGLEETHGLVTVPTAEADHVRACIKTVKPFKGVRVTIVETTDAAAGTTTFSAHVEKTGVILIIR